ncbi:MAG TPA: hypothetical protein VJV79_01210 [Polyangiaceae bacterium]|nr:hypothetical protein [Polyangiaceae bacterium]
MSELVMSENGWFHGGVAVRCRFGWLLVLAASWLPGCARSDELPDAVGRSAQSVVSAEIQPKLAAAAGHRVVPDTASVELRRAAAGYEIEVQSPKGFAPGAYDPVLNIGGTPFRKYRYSPTAGLYGVVYTLSEAQFAELADGSTIVIDYGLTKIREQAFGTLSKSSVVP